MRSNQDVVYLELQGLHQWHVRLLLAVPPAALIFITCRQVILHVPWGPHPVSNGGLIFLTVLLLAVYFRLITVKLETQLRRNGEIRVGLRGLWRRRRILIQDIRRATPTVYDPVAEYGGYGIRSGPRGRAYIADGNQAVEVLLHNGSRILIGSQRPAELVRQIALQQGVTA